MPHRASRACVALAVMLASATAAADPSERSDRARGLHALASFGGGFLYLSLDLGIKADGVPDECRWCEANRLDMAVRSRLRWSAVQTANTLSNFTSYIGTSVFGLGLLATSNHGDWRRLYDDVTPVIQAGLATVVVTWVSKAIAARRRPFATFGTEPVRDDNDFNTSFFSGHTSLAFTLATSSAMVAHLRGYRSETALWIGGLTLATATGYLRIAGDAHYATDVIAGALFGGAIGIAIPLLFHADVLTDEDLSQIRSADDRPLMFTFGSTF